MLATSAWAAVKLSGPGPFTVCAPINAAFAKLPPGTIDRLVKPENKAMLTSILMWHVVAGRMSAAMLARNADSHYAEATLTKGQGERLAVTKGLDGGWWVADAKGGKARITMPTSITRTA